MLKGFKVVDNLEKYIGKDGFLDFSKSPIPNPEGNLEKIDMDLMYNLEFNDKNLDIVRRNLLLYLLKLEGAASRQLSEEMPYLGSHTIVSQDIKLGQEYFKSLFWIIGEIEGILREKGKFSDVLDNLSTLKMKLHGFLVPEEEKRQKEIKQLKKQLKKLKEEEKQDSSETLLSKTKEIEVETLENEENS